MNRGFRMSACVAAAAAILLVTSGCASLQPMLDSILDPGVSRGDDGRVTETLTIPSPELTTGDCFSFLDEGNLAEVSVTPCASQHTHIVIGQGSLAKATVPSSDDLRAAVSTGCEVPFAEYKATATGARPELEFIVANEASETSEPSDDYRYSCVATHTS